MRRILLIAVLGLAATAPSAAAAVPLDAARVRLVACHAGATPPDRYLTVEASMRSLRSGDHMQVRFELYRRTRPGAAVVRVTGPGLWTWNDATSGVARFRFRKTIANLPARAQYRVVVRYRWLDSSGDPFAGTVRRTVWCAEPDPRPNLRPVSIAVAPGPGAGRSTYFVLVRNAGVSASGDFDVQLTIAGSPQAPVTTAGLAPGARRSVAIVGRDCPPGETVHVAVDPDDRVDEANEADGRAAFPCP